MVGISSERDSLRKYLKNARKPKHNVGKCTAQDYYFVRKYILFFQTYLFKHVNGTFFMKVVRENVVLSYNGCLCNTLI
jgi:hypothetical protein